MPIVTHEREYKAHAFRFRLRARAPAARGTLEPPREVQCMFERGRITGAVGGNRD